MNDYRYQMKKYKKELENKKKGIFTPKPQKGKRQIKKKKSQPKNTGDSFNSTDLRNITFRSHTNFATDTINHDVCFGKTVSFKIPKTADRVIDTNYNEKIARTDFNLPDFGEKVSITIPRGHNFMLSSLYLKCSLTPESKEIMIKNTNNDTNECIICWETLKENVILCATCNYAYHKLCYTEQNTRLCPNCRQYVSIDKVCKIVD